MKIKRIISAVVAFTLFFTPTEISAGAYSVSPPEIEYTKNASIIDSGTCGAELKWWLEDDGTLTISGNDTMTSAPWGKYSSRISSVVIDKDVKNIYEYAFSNLSYLTSVEFKGNKITSIEDGAFSGCRSLSSITIPESVSYIGYKAFYNSGCYTATGSVHYIGSWAVGFDEGITSVNIKSGTKRIAEKAFSNGKSIKTLILPNTLTEIPNGAFSGTGITTLTIPESVEKIGMEAFKFCISLEALSLKNGIVSIGSSAFSNCNRLESLYIPESVNYIGSQAFYDCTSLTSIKIPNRNCPVDPTVFGFSTYTSIVRDMYAPVCSDAAAIAQGNSNYKYHAMDGSGESDGVSWKFTVADGTLSFSGSGILSPSTSSRSWGGLKNDIKKVIINGSITEISKSAFSEFVSLESVDIKAPVETIGEKAFSDCASLSNVTIPYKTSVIGAGAFSNTAIKEIVLPKSLTEINASVFSGCAFLSSVNIPASVTSIGAFAFSGCTSLSSVSLPDTVTMIGSSAFSGCSSLSSINIPSSVTVIEESAFSECSALSSMDIPASVTKIEKKAFYDCSGLKDIYFRSEDTTIYTSADTLPSNTVIYGKNKSGAKTYADSFFIQTVSDLSLAESL